MRARARSSSSTASKPARFTQSVMEELSKAFSDEDRDKVIAKALGRVEELEKPSSTRTPRSPSPSGTCG